MSDRNCGHRQRSTVIHITRCFRTYWKHTHALTVLKPSCELSVSVYVAAVQFGGSATVYLQLSAELGRNVDLHIAAKAAGRSLMHMRSAHRTRKECSLVRSGAGGLWGPTGAQLMVGLDGWRRCAPRRVAGIFAVILWHRVIPSNV